MDLKLQLSALTPYHFPTTSVPPHFIIPCNRRLTIFPNRTLRHSSQTTSYTSVPHILRTSRSVFTTRRAQLNRTTGENKGEIDEENSQTNEELDKFGFLVKRGLLLAVLVFGVIRCQRVMAVEGLVGHSRLYLKGIWPKFLQVLFVFKEQGLILAALLGLSAFFSMAETSITTLSPWKVRELAEKEGEDGVFKMLRTDVTRFLTTILIGTTVVNIGATALVTEAATAAFGEAGVSAATGVMTVAILLLTEITPKSIAVHNALEVARIVIVTLEDVVEEIVGEIFDENDSKEEIEKKTGYVVMRAEGVYDVDANTSIDQLSDDLDIILPEGHQYETVSGFICEAFGYIPRSGESIKVVLQKAKREDDNDDNKEESDCRDQKNKHQTFKLEILDGNCRKVSIVRFELINDQSATETKEITRVVPRIWKRKWRDDGYSSSSDDEKSHQETSKIAFSTQHVVAKDKDDKYSNKQ